MNEVPEENYSPLWPEGDREPLPLVGDEREILTAYLDWHRETLALKCAGLDAEALNERAAPPSRLSLHGLVRHLAGAEQWWFELQFAGAEAPMINYSDAWPDQDFEDLSGSFDEALAVWRTQVERSRQIAAAASLDDTGVSRRTGEPVSLRRILVHMLAEYARHDGHADLLRERIDGRTGQ
ncbi:DinB family protein [Luedemannella helvata]|uniref:DinB family protein n=1 Tax=Luedemannella helvata TaxID=349315 RepID=A0ABP4WWW7_9ACTN